MDIVQHTRESNRTDQPSNDDHEMTRYLEATDPHAQPNLSPQTISQSLDFTAHNPHTIISVHSPPSQITVSGDKFKQNFPQIHLLSNSFNSISNNKENLDYFNQHNNDDDDEIFSFHDTHEDNRFSQSSTNSSSPSSPSDYNHLQHQEDNIDNEDRDENGIRRKRRKQVLPQQNFHFTQNINHELINTKTSGKEETQDTTDCEVEIDDSFKPKMRKLSKSVLDSGKSREDEGEHKGDKYTDVKIDKTKDMEINLDITINENKQSAPETDQEINKTSCPSILMASECSKLINELSHCAVEAFRRSFSRTSAKVQISSSNPSNNENETLEERMIEQTLLKLEPHISELVGQSLRTSIEALKNEMFASLRSVNMSLSENEHSTTDLTTNNNNKTNVTDNHNSHEKLKNSDKKQFKDTSTAVEHSIDKYTSDTRETASVINQNQINLLTSMPPIEKDIKQKIQIESPHLPPINNIETVVSSQQSFSLPFCQASTKGNYTVSVDSNLPNLLANSSCTTFSSDDKASTSTDFMSIPIDNFSLNSVDPLENNNLTDYAINTTPTTHNDYISSSSSSCCMADFNEQIKQYLHEMRQRFPQFSSILSGDTEAAGAFSTSASNGLLDSNVSAPLLSSQLVDHIPLPNLLSDISSNENVTPALSTGTVTSASASGNLTPSTAAAAAAALANALGFPIPLTWPPKTLTADIHQNFGLTTNLYSQWPWKFLASSPYSLKYCDQSTLLQPNSLMHNTVNLLSQLNKVNTVSAFNTCLNSKFSPNNESEQNDNKMAFNNTNSSLPSVTSLDEQLEAMPLVVRYENKINSISPTTSNNSTTHNNGSDKLLHSINVGNTNPNANTVTTTMRITPTIHDANLFPGSNVSRRRRTKVTDTRLTHSRVSRYPNNTLSNCISANSSGSHHHSQRQHHQSFPQSTTGIIDANKALNLITPTTIASFCSSGDEFQTEEKETLLTNQNLVTGLNLSRYCNSISTNLNNNNSNNDNVRSDDCNSVKYRSDNQIHSSGSNNSSPSPISLRLSGNSKELSVADANRINHEPVRLEGHYSGSLQTSELEKNIYNTNNRVNEKSSSVNSLHQYESFEKMLTKTLRNYPLSLKSNFINKAGVQPATMGTISSPMSSVFPESSFNNANKSSTETNSTPMSISPSITSSPMTIVSPSSSICPPSFPSDSNQRRFLSKFNPIYFLNSRLSNSLPPIPPMFFDPTDNLLPNNTNNSNSNITQRSSANTANENVHSYTDVQSEEQEHEHHGKQSPLQHSNLLNYPNCCQTYPLPFLHRSPGSYSLSLKPGSFSMPQSFASGTTYVTGNSLTHAAGDPSSNNNNNTSSTTVSHTSSNTSISNLQSNLHRQQQQHHLPSANLHQQHNHQMSYINKLYDKLSSSENLFSMKMDKSVLLNDSFNCESNGITLSESYQNQLISCSHELRMTTTLTPVHLRKAKLMFFYTRYPNSTLIKMYFPDVKFYKNNTAQLVKWFSNFRILQMSGEKQLFS
ncbi:unnamed protein product [Heterobilharzia americana]|nr:unnamed protein product [Heterobilharzia americana]